MNNRRKICVLHITPDEKFFDNVFAAWEKKDIFENKAVCIKKKSERKEYKYIKNVEQVKLLTGKNTIRKYLCTEIYDVVYFHSLPLSLYQFLKYIPKDRIVIWWGWGYDLYSEMRKGPCVISPLLKLDLFKRETKYFFLNDLFGFRVLLKTILRLCIPPVLMVQRKKVLHRIDYFQPVVKLEYSMMCQNSDFKAEEFYCESISDEFEIEKCLDMSGDILLGNSATPTNNHLDILNVVKKYSQDNQHIILPLSYGDQRYKKWLSRRIKEANVIKLENYLPEREYLNILDKCSYAVFGTIRQQALGNINYALSKGIKVFLYKDSVVYKNYKDLGFAIYSIEEIDTFSFKTPLTKEELVQNAIAIKKEKERRDRIYDSCVKKIIKRFL